MFAIMMGIIVGIDAFLASQAIIDYASSNEWHHAVESVAFLSLTAWALIRAIRNEK